MFSKSKRFTDQINATPAVGQYDISKGPAAQGGAVFFPKDKRFKEQGATNDVNILDISNCSTTSTKSTGSINNGVFRTPRKPVSKANNKVLNQMVSSDELNRLSAHITELEEEIRKLRTENEMLQKLKDDELNEDERQAMESNLAEFKEEIEKLRNQIEDELKRNKELVYEQNRYECSLQTMQADLELANNRIVALQQQIISLEQMHSDITDSREELESQCSRLHGINIALQEEKLEFQDRIDEIENELKNTWASNEQLSSDLFSCKEKHKLEMKTVQKTFQEKLTEEHKSLEKTVESYRNEIGHLKLEIDESRRNEIETIDKLKSEKEALAVSLETLKDEYSRAQEEILHLQEMISRKEEESLQNVIKCQNLEDQIIALQQQRIEEVKSLTSELKTTKINLERSEHECKTISQASCDIQIKYEKVCHAHKRLENDLNMTKNDKIDVDKQIVEAESLINQLRENEQAQRSVAETLATKLEVCTITITHLNKVNIEYQDTIESNGRKVQDVVEKVGAMASKCEDLETKLVQSQKNRDVEVERLTKKLEQSEILLIDRNNEYETLNETMKQIRQNYDDVRGHCQKVENEFQITTLEKNTLVKQLLETQKNLDALKQSEDEQRIVAKTLREKVEGLKIENERDQIELKEINRSEIEKIKDRIIKIQQENRSLTAAHEKAIKLKQEFGRRLIEAQKNLSQKEMQLQSYQKDIETLHAKYEDDDSWKRKFEELEEKIAPFQEQLDAYELEKQALLNKNSESQSEIDKLGQQYARLLGHQNLKQKIHHVQKLKNENTSLKKEVAKLREDLNKEKFNKKRVEEKLSKATGTTKRFDPSLAFKHNSLGNKENTPLK